MTTAHTDGQVTAPGDAYRALLAVSEAIVSHRDLSALFHELAGRLHQVARFDHLALHLYEAESGTMRLHVLEPSEPAVPSSATPGRATSGRCKTSSSAVILSPGPALQIPPGDLEVRDQKSEVRSQRG